MWNDFQVSLCLNVLPYLPPLPLTLTNERDEKRIPGNHSGKRQMAARPTEAPWKGIRRPDSQSVFLLLCSVAYRKPTRYPGNEGGADFLRHNCLFCSRNRKWEAPSESSRLSVRATIRIKSRKRSFIRHATLYRKNVGSFLVHNEGLRWSILSFRF